MFDQQLTFSDSFDNLMNSFMEFDVCQTPYYQRSNHFEFKEFEDMGGDIGLWDDVNIPSFCDNLAMAEIMNSEHFDSSVVGGLESTDTEVKAEIQRNLTSSSEQEEKKRRSGGSGNGRCKTAALELEEIQKYFDLPITKAAKELKVGLTVLKKRCRELNIMRWPHRKIKSLKCLIDNVKELGLTREIEMLEENRRMLEMVPELELTERTKKLRQACFKANYKKRRSLAAALSN